jgi:hypothetical protein
LKEVKMMKKTHDDGTEEIVCRIIWNDEAERVIDYWRPYVLRDLQKRKELEETSFIKRLIRKWFS